MGALSHQGFVVSPIMDESGYTNQIRIKRPSGTYILTIEEEKSNDVNE